MNAQGQVVGSAELTGGQNAASRTHAVLWQNDVLIDLNTRIIGGSAWEITSAAAINNDGAIVGQAQHRQDQHAVLLLPTR